MDQMQAFYDAITPRTEEALAYCDKLRPRCPARRCAESDASAVFLTVSFPVECWKQPRVPDTGATSLDCVVEPVP
jgi:hypothetical protein